MVEAGGGPSSFNTVTLLKTLTGPLFDAEVAKLTKQYETENTASRPTRNITPFSRRP
jgi:hypothetical protein